MRKFLVVLCSMALIAGTIAPMPVMAAAGDEVYDFDGDIIGNPWEELFTTEASTEAPTEAPTEKPTEGPTEAPTEKPTEAPTEAPTEKPIEGEIVITKQPEDLRLAAGYIGVFSVKATGSNLKYQWQLSKDNGKTWSVTTVSGATTDTVTCKMGTGADGRLMRCVITDDKGNKVISNTAKFVCDQSVVPDCSITITKQPVDGYAAAGKRTAFTVEAEGNIAAYQWEVSKDGGVTWNYTTAEGFNTPTLMCKLSALVDGRLVRCGVIDVNGTRAYSEAVAMHMWPNTINIETQPKITYALSGATFNMSIQATGEELTYKWQVSRDNGVTWTDTTVTGATTDTVTMKMSSSVSGRLLRCVLTDKYANTVISNSAKMVLTALSITAQPTDVHVASGVSFGLSVKATGTDLTYQWEVSKDGGVTWNATTVTGATTDTVTMKMSSTLNGRLMRCVITETSTGNKVTSDAVTMYMQ